LQQQLTTIKIDGTQKSAIMSQAKDLGNAKVPSSISPSIHAVIQQAYHSSFIHAFSNIMRICAALGFVAAIMTVIFIKNAVVKAKTT
jgi:hypothetical protein